MDLDLDAALTEQLKRFQTGGVNAAMDASDLSLPGVLVRPPTLAPRFGKSCVDVTWEVWAVVPDTGLRAATRRFGPLLSKIQDVLGHTVAEFRTREPVLMPDGAVVPAYQFTYETRIYLEATNA